MAMKLLQRLDAYARTAGRRTAYRELCGDARELSYEQLRDRVLSFARCVRGQVKAGEVVMLGLPNRIEYPVAFLGVLAAECSVFPVSAEIAEVELRALAREGGGAVDLSSERE